MKFAQYLDECNFDAPYMPKNILHDEIFVTMSQTLWAKAFSLKDMMFYSWIGEWGIWNFQFVTDCSGRGYDLIKGTLSMNIQNCY